MRYYEIDIFSDAAFTKKVKSWSSLDSFGKTNPGALNVELDIPLTPSNTPNGNVNVRIWGIPIKDISTDWGSLYFQMKAGMAKGLPLANPNQRGLILKGKVYQSFGNWQGVNMSLDFIIQPETGGWESDQKNWVLDWKKGTTLKEALDTSFNTALGKTIPSLNMDFSLSPNLVATKDEALYCSTLTQFSQQVKDLSKSVNKSANFNGVVIAKNGDTFKVSDFSATGTDAKILEFQDFIGQPTWIDPITISVKLVMRHDITMLDVVKLPDVQEKFGKVSAKSYEFIRNGLSFVGRWKVLSLRHIGNFRQPDANSWVTVLTLTPEQFS